MRQLRILAAVIVLAGMALVLSGCCSRKSCWNPLRWWEPGGGDCCPCGDPCDPCDTRGC